jgi:hypothetical protein
MTAKFTYSDIMTTLKQFSEVSYNKYGSHSYAAGALESSLASIVADLPRHKQAELIRHMEAMTKLNQG